MSLNPNGHRETPEDTLSHDRDLDRHDLDLDRTRTLESQRHFEHLNQLPGENGRLVPGGGPPTRQIYGDRFPQNILDHRGIEPGPGDY